MTDKDLTKGKWKSLNIDLTRWMIQFLYTLKNNLDEIPDLFGLHIILIRSGFQSRGSRKLVPLVPPVPDKPDLVGQNEI